MPKKSVCDTKMFFIIRAAFAGFDAEIVANFTERQIASVATDYNLDLNKVRGAINNANRILEDKFDLDLSVPHISYAVDDMIKERVKDYRCKLFQGLAARLPTNAPPPPLSSLLFFVFLFMMLNLYVFMRE
ncbi:uncharacterized protein LOC131225750 [Magnolia sinica]|uniref:uncharacterized protein LOC131225750 n=1 Tax=Magnolia sinica TaxID=86752 RepID=UPI00265B525E|nr:uncharacterized protein LOC131225750 [Magnolia sinica]